MQVKNIVSHDYGGDTSITGSEPEALITGQIPKALQFLAFHPETLDIGTKDAFLLQQDALEQFGA